MRIVVDRDACVGHARCFATDPELFPLDEDDYAAPDAREVPAGLEERARRGVASCPERALSLQ